MRLLNQSCEAFVQEPGLDGIYKQIERAGRTCYRSSDKITPESAKPFVDRMIKSKHTAMLEHGTVYLKISDFLKHGVSLTPHVSFNYRDNKYSKWNRVITVVDDIERCTDYITTNLRVIAENDWWDDLKYLCEPTEHHKKRYTLSCTTALHCYKDLTRHRTFSFAIESTRYCNYSKTEKFGDMAFIIPTWLNLKEGQYFNGKYGTPLFEEFLQSSTYSKMSERFILDLVGVERTYNELVENGWQAQQAAEVLPQCIKGDMIITGFEDDWKHLLDLRYYGTTGAPHPMVKELATLMKEELAKLGFNY